MSRSYRYDPDGEAFSGRPSWERGDEDFGCGLDEEGEGMVRRSRPRKARQVAPVHPPMSEEWAMEVVAPTIAKELRGLAERKIIALHEVEDYTQILNVHVCRVLPLYDSGHVGGNGKPASVERYLNVAVCSAVTDIVRTAMTRKSCLPTAQMPDPVGGEERECDRKCSDNHYVSDGCRSIRDLWFRMDLETLCMMLTREERITTSLRVQGYTYPEIAEEVSEALGVSVDRFHIMNVTMERIRKAARKCGFVPSCEMGRRILENRSHFFRSATRIYD